MMKISKILCIVLCLVMLLGIAACGSAANTDAPKDNGTPKADNGPAKSGDKVDNGEPVTMTLGCSGTYFGSFLYGADGGSNDSATSLVFDYVFQTDPITKETTSKILEDWYYEDDLTFVCKLKPGIMFSNGDEADAEDVIFSVAHFFERGKFQNIFGPLDIDACYARDKYTAVFVYTGPFGPGVTDNNLLFYNKDWCHEVGWDSEDWYFNPVGTGPYKVVEYITDNTIRLELREDRWDKDVDYGVDTWVLKFYPDQATMFIDLQLGNIDLCTGIGTMDYANYMKAPVDGISLCEVSLNDILYFPLAFKNTDVFDDIAVRKAIAYGVDWDAIGVMGFGDFFRKPTSMIASSSPFHKDIGSYEYNPEMAKQILEEAGYKPGDINVRMFTMQNAHYKSMGEGMQYYLGELGINLTLEFGDMASVIGAWLGPNATDVGFQNNPIGSVTGDPLMSWNSLMTNYASFQHTVCPDAKFNELAEAALNTVDKDKRIDLYAQAQQYIYDNYLTYPITEYCGAIAYKTDMFDADLIAHSAFTLTAINLRAIAAAF